MILPSLPVVFGTINFALLFEAKLISALKRRIASAPRVWDLPPHLPGKLINIAFFIGLKNI